MKINLPAAIAAYFNSAEEEAAAPAAGMSQFEEQQMLAKIDQVEALVDAQAHKIAQLRAAADKLDKDTSDALRLLRLRLDITARA